MPVTPPDTTPTKVHITPGSLFVQAGMVGSGFVLALGLTWSLSSTLTRIEGNQAMQEERRNGDRKWMEQRFNSFDDRLKALEKKK